MKLCSHVIDENVNSELLVTSFKRTFWILHTSKTFNGLQKRLI